ncbi:MAG: MFS transporter [Candidatus Parvarchaeota archaeon]|nr:MFS transporter [Candidatus Parvarchaeota archaeon]
MGVYNLSYKSGILLLTKTLRTFGFGFLSIILPLYLLKLGYSALFIGVVLSASVFSSVMYNVLVSKFSDRFGRGRSLVILSLLMAFSGVLLILNISAVSLVIASIIGAMSVTGTETGPFVAVEQSAIATSTDQRNRTNVFGLYNFLGYSAAAFGALFSGLPSLFSKVSGYYILLYIYIGISIALAVIYYTLGRNLELKKKVKPNRDYHISKSDKKIIVKLSLLFSVDAFGGGFVLQSLLSLWFASRYGFNIGTLSLIFVTTNIITAFSILTAPKLAKKIGLLNTMVFTHIPSNLFLIAIPFAPTALYAVVFLFLRQSISQMDVPTRQSYTMAIVKPEDRTALAGITNIPRSVAQGISPGIASYFIGILNYTAPFFISGVLKIIYDISIFFTFRKIKPPEEKR